MQQLSTDSQERKDTPIFSGFVKYFPKAMAEVARLSKAGNDKHNPGQPLHWSRDKSSDHGDCIIRHQIDAGSIDLEDGFLHDVKVAWRAMAQLEVALESLQAQKSEEKVEEVSRLITTDTGTLLVDGDVLVKAFDCSLSSFKLHDSETSGPCLPEDDYILLGPEDGWGDMYINDLTVGDKYTIDNTTGHSLFEDDKGKSRSALAFKWTFVK